ncbi:MAG: hypothetical protein UV76_C0001G0058, partial [Candidatus Nomurabacteria bacterium GW2011_GWA2_43_15]
MTVTKCPKKLFSFIMVLLGYKSLTRDANSFPKTYGIT